MHTVQRNRVASPNLLEERLFFVVAVTVLENAQKKMEKTKVKCQQTSKFYVGISSIQEGVVVLRLTLGNNTSAGSCKWAVGKVVVIPAHSRRLSCACKCLLRRWALSLGYTADIAGHKRTTGAYNRAAEENW